MMQAWTVVLVVSLSSVTGAVPPCSTECPVASVKFSYVLNKNYSYAYSGTSKVQLRGVEGGLAETRWEKQLYLKWLTPCDVAIAFKGIKVDGETGPPVATLLEKYPLLVAVTDGRVQRVCSHPDDDAWSINMKKGVASILQNSLPSLSITNSGLTFTETDVVGTCPTKYEVRNENDKTVVVKDKNHRMCEDRFPTPDMVHLPWLKGPLPMQESRSTCTQEIINGTISAVVCEDKNVVRPSYGFYKFVEATQTSQLRLVSDVGPLPESIFLTSQSQQVVSSSLLYDYMTPKKDSSLVPQLEQTLRHICQLTKESLESESVKWLDKAVRLMRQVPDNSISQMYDKIRRKQLCAEHEKLKDLFLDAISFVHESGCVPVMVKELMNGHVNKGRAVLYSAALYLTPRPTAGNMKDLKPLFELPQLIPSVSLSAASMINTFCRHDAQCLKQSSVRDSYIALKTKLQSQCSPFSDQEAQNAALLTLKILGNIGLLNHDVSTSILRCVRAQGPPVAIRVVAAETLRLMSCEGDITDDLVDIVLDPEMNTEVRVASYRVAIHCVHENHLKKIVRVISEEENTQARGFILSHLQNLQKTNTPHKERLRRLLTNFILPINFETDARKYSHSYELSYFSKRLGLGTEVESNLIYSPGSFVPRSLGANLTAALDGISMNVADFGVRLEGLDPIFAKLFGPAGYFHTSNNSKVLGDLLKLFQRNEEQNKTGRRQLVSTENSILTTILSEIYQNSIFAVRGDLAVRFMGQDVFFSSTSIDLSTLSLSHLKAEIHSLIHDLIQACKTLKIDTARMLRPDLDYSFPTIQGTLFKMNAQMSVVAGLKAQTHLNDFSVHSGFTIMPSFSVEADGFIGYDNHITNTGLKINTAVSSNNGLILGINSQHGQKVQLHIDLPKKMNLFSVQTEIFLMKNKKGQPDTKIFPPSMQDNRIHRNSCVDSLEPVFGLKMCYELDVPDVIHNNALPLGAPAFARFSINRTQPAMKGYLINGTLENFTNRKTLTLSGKTYGSSTTKVFDIQMSVLQQLMNRTFCVALNSSRIQSNAKITLINLENEKSVDLFGMTAYDKKTSQRTAKFSLITTKTSFSQEYNLECFYSNNRSLTHQTPIISINLFKKKNGSHTSVDIHGGTRQACTHNISLDFKIGVDVRPSSHSWLPSSLRLRMFELEGGLARWKTIFFIHSSAGSGQQRNYSSRLKVTQDGSQLAYLKADLRLQGTLAVDLMTQLLMEAGVQVVKYKGAASVHFGSNQAGAALHMLSVVRSATLLRMETSYSHSQTGCSVRALVEVPDLMNSMKALATVVIRPNEENAAHTEAAVLRGSSVLLHIEGPMSINLNRETLEGNVQWKISLIGQDPFNLSSMVVIGNNSQFMFLMLRTHRGQPLLMLESSTSSRSLEETDLQANVLINNHIDVETHITLNTRQVQMSLSAFLFPNAPDARRVKISSQLDLATMMLSADVWWDADRDNSKKFRLEVTFATLPHLSEYSSLQGTIKYQDVICNFLAMTDPVQLRHSAIRKTRFRFGIQTGERKDMNIEFENSIEIRNSSTYFEIKMKYFGLENKKYMFMYSMDLEDLNGLQNFKTESHIAYSSPTGHETSLTMEVTHQSSPTTRIAQFKGATRVSTIKQPLEMDLTWTGGVRSMNLNWRANQSAAWTLLDWQMNKTASGTIQSCNFNFNLKAMEEFLFDAVKILTLQNTCFVSECADYDETHASYNLHHNIIRSVPIQPNVSPIEALATYFPLGANIGRAEYSVAGKYTYNQLADSGRYEGKVNHPLLSRDVTVKVEYSISGSNHRGSFELCVFPDTADKITGSLAAIMLANNTIKIEANLTTRLLGYHPKVVIDAAVAPHTIAFDMQLFKNASQEPNFKIDTKLDQISKQATVVGFMVATNSTTLDLSGVMEPQTFPECQGVKITTSSTIAALGNHSCVVSVCGPALLELTIGRKDRSGKVYHIQFGITNPIGVEGNLIVHDQERKTALDVLRTHFILYPHIDIKFSYMHEELRRFEEEVRAVFLTAAEEGGHWVQQIFQAVVHEAHRRHITFPPPVIIALTHKIQNEVKKMSTYLIQEKLEPTFEILRRFSNTQVAYYAKKVSYTAWHYMQWAKSQLPKDIYHPYQEHIVWSKELPSYNFIVRKVGEQVMEVLKTGGENLLPTIEYFFRELEGTDIFQALEEDMVAFITSYSSPEQRKMLLEVFDRVIATLKKDLAPLKNNPTLLWASLLTLRNINEAMGKVTLTPLTAMRDMLWAYNSHNTIPSNNLVQLYDLVWPSHNTWGDLLPPWNRTAMVVGGTEILTFDGARLRIPLSKCEVILASFSENIVTLSHPVQGSRAQVTVVTSRVIVIVRPDFHVLVNGRDIGHQDVTVGEVTVLVWHLQITITLPFVKVRVLRQQRLVSVEARGWTFGHLAGMLGTFDGEAGNDHLMSTGVTAPDLWQLVKSWQEDQHCPTPPVDPITPSIRKTEKIAHCYPLLGVWARCNALVRPEPFIHMCYSTPDPCDAAEAYRSLCATKGVEPLIPRGC